MSAANEHATNKAVIANLRSAMYDWDQDHVAQRLRSTFHADAAVHLAHPFEDLDGADGLISDAYTPLHHAVPDLERRDLIVIGGSSDDETAWVGCCGYYTGTFARPWLDIPPTGRQVSLRYHEFYRMVDGKVAELQALWDLPELMMQAGCWPMGPSLGREWHVPGPSTQDGLAHTAYDDERSATSLGIVAEMLTDMGRHPTEPVEAMRLERYWHPKFSWYGPSGIGTARGVAGFRAHHQIPFLAAMPDRVAFSAGRNAFGDGDYVGFTAWPGMQMTLTGGGWLGIAPAGTQLTMRSLDFWRIENGLIRENWVLVDLLHAWHQLGVDVFARMRELVGRPDPRTIPNH